MAGPTAGHVSGQNPEKDAEMQYIRPKLEVLSESPRPSGSCTQALKAGLAEINVVMTGTHHSLHKSAA